MILWDEGNCFFQVEVVALPKLSYGCKKALLLNSFKWVGQHFRDGVFSEYRCYGLFSDFPMHRLDQALYLRRKLPRNDALKNKGTVKLISLFHGSQHAEMVSEKKAFQNMELQSCARDAIVKLVSAVGLMQPPKKVAFWRYFRIQSLIRQY
ncbi:hypothetical protein KP509_07G030000 [Ceratopteris richardii]|uniref:Uncharacterized protein n=1 Tax=Ceratopteris richardii TaxID=49495 RepID=A0A8T2UGG3_CERRI|nr:hypothetical protein KP509_07G030000 [Ceratopteris richardii]